MAPEITPRLAAARTAAAALLADSGNYYDLTDRAVVAQLVIYEFWDQGRRGSRGERLLVQLVMGTDPTFAQLCSLAFPAVEELVRIAQADPDGRAALAAIAEGRT